MVNNKHLIIPLLEFKSKDSFYFCSLIQRKKDHLGVRIGESNNNSRVIKNYYLTSIEKLELHWDEMVKLSELFGARVMINLNPRNFQKAGFHLLQKVANQMSNGDFTSIHKAYTSVCGEYHSEIDKRWLVDVDDIDIPNMEYIADYITSLHKEIKNRDYKILAKIPTRNGWHIITHPFNLETFHTRWGSSLDVHKNNPSLLYFPDSIK